jgi:hypothetical protein
MPNPIAAFMRERVALDEQGLKLGIEPRTYTRHDIKVFFLAAADEIDRLEAASAKPE